MICARFCTYRFSASRSRKTRRHRILLVPALEMGAVRTIVEGQAGPGTTRVWVGKCDQRRRNSRRPASLTTLRAPFKPREGLNGEPAAFTRGRRVRDHV